MAFAVEDVLRYSAVGDAGGEAKGRYPVLIYAPSDSSVSWENADLCEYLASHGYVVLASPSMGVSTRDMTDDLGGIDAQARDISFLITYARSLPDTDLSEVAVVSWSWGGISSLFASARDPSGLRRSSRDIIIFALFSPSVFLLPRAGFTY